MKFILTVATLIGFSSFGFSQITWDKADADTARGFETSEDIETHNKVTFTKAGEYRWVRTYNQSCEVKNAICDKNSCYLETTDSADFTVGEGESFDMICHFYPYNKCCPDIAQVSLYVYKINEPEINSTATYHLDLWCASLSVDVVTSGNAIQVYPNPASSTLFIENVSETSNVSFTSLLGATAQVSSNGNGSYDISGLTQGVYFVTVETEGETFTKRFVKQ